MNRPTAIRSSLIFLGWISLFLAKAQLPITPSTVDLWDVSNGAEIVRSSPMDNGWYDPRNALGGQFGPSGFEQPGLLVFSDEGATNGLYFIEWRTKEPVLLRAFRLFAAGDGANIREFGKFRLTAKSVGSSVFDRLIYDYTATHPFAYLDGRSGLLVQADVQEILAGEFRAEFTTVGPPISQGTRLVELDGFSVPISELITSSPELVILPAVELRFPTKAGFQYQIQYSTNLESPVWTDLGMPHAGTGESLSIFERAAGTRRYYRLTPATQP